MPPRYGAPRKDGWGSVPAIFGTLVVHHGSGVAVKSESATSTFTLISRAVSRVH